MNKMQAQVLEFHNKFDLLIGHAPHIPDEATMQLRLKLIDEEYNVEFKEAYANRNLVEMIDAIGDMLYVIHGMAVSMGVDMEPFFDEIHRSNMSKIWEDGTVHKREDGKVIKPDTYSPADIAGVLQRTPMPERVEGTHAYEISEGLD